MDDHVTGTGPIDYLVVEFPGNRMTGEGLPILVELEERGIIKVLDLVFLLKDLDGSVAAVELHELADGSALDVTVFEGARSGLLDGDDLTEAADAIAPGCSAGVLNYENRWAATFAAALRRGGAQMVAGGRVPLDEGDGYGERTPDPERAQEVSALPLRPGPGLQCPRVSAAAVDTGSTDGLGTSRRCPRCSSHPTSRRCIASAPTRRSGGAGRSAGQTSIARSCQPPGRRDTRRGLRRRPPHPWPRRAGC